MELKGLLKRALELWHERRAGPPVEGYQERLRARTR
jgi:transposase